MIKEDCFTREEVAVLKVAAHLRPTLNIKESKISVEQDRVVTTLNIIKLARIVSTTYYDTTIND